MRMDAIELQELAYPASVTNDTRNSTFASDDDQIVYPIARQEDFPTSSDPGHNHPTAAQRDSSEAVPSLCSAPDALSSSTPPGAVTSSDSAGGLTYGPVPSHDVSIGFNTLATEPTDAARIARTTTSTIPSGEFTFVKGCEEEQIGGKDRVKQLPPVPPKSPLRLEPQPTGSSTPTSLPSPPSSPGVPTQAPATPPEDSQSQRAPTHTYASSDPGHGAAFVASQSRQPFPLRSSTGATPKRSRTMAGYRTSHFPARGDSTYSNVSLHSGMNHGSYLADRYRYRPLDAILESMQQGRHGGYERSAVYTGILPDSSDLHLPRPRVDSCESLTAHSHFANASMSTITETGRRRNKLRKRKPSSPTSPSTLTLNVTCNCHCTSEAAEDAHNARRMAEFRYPYQPGPSHSAGRDTSPKRHSSCDPRKRRSISPSKKRTPSPSVKRRRTLSFKVGLARVARAVSLRTSTGTRSRPSLKVLTNTDALSAYIVEPFVSTPRTTSNSPYSGSAAPARRPAHDEDDNRPLSWISSTTLNQYRMDASTSSDPDTRPLSVTSTESSFTYSKSEVHVEERMRRPSVTFEDAVRTSWISGAEVGRASSSIRHAVGDAGRPHVRGLAQVGELGRLSGGQFIKDLRSDRINPPGMGLLESAGGLAGAETTGGDKRNGFDSAYARSRPNHPSFARAQRSPSPLSPPQSRNTAPCQCSCHSAPDMATAMTATMSPLALDRRLGEETQAGSPLRSASTAGPHRPPIRSLTISSNAATSASTSTCASNESETSWAGAWPGHPQDSPKPIRKGWGSTTSTPPTSPGVSDASCSAPFTRGTNDGVSRGYFEDADRPQEAYDTRARSISRKRHQDQPRKLTKKRRELSRSKDRQSRDDIERGRRSGEKRVGSSRARSRSKSILGVGRTAAERARPEVEEATVREFLPPVRPPSPLWANSSGMLPSPYARTSTPDLPSRARPQEVTPTDALASLAFTGHTTALSSSALAAITSRFASPSASTSTPSPRLPPWTAAFSVITGNIPEGDAFDPYEESKKEKEKTGSQLTWKQSIVSRTKGLSHRPSLSFLRNDRDRARTSSSASRSQPQTPITPVRPQRGRRAVARDCSPDTLRRWTLAMADVPDEILVQELEKLRLKGHGDSTKRRKRRRGTTSAAASSAGHSAENETRPALAEGLQGRSEDEWVKLPGRPADEGESSSDDDLSSDDERDDDASPSNSADMSPRHVDPLQDDLGWKTARRALLCCRELVRTERNYQTRLRQLLSGDTSTPPPPLVRSYVPALLRASEALLARLEDDPSAWGVSAAFVGVEEEIEAAFVAWAGVVGTIFTREESRKLVKRERSSSNVVLTDSAPRTPDRATFAGRSQSHTMLASPLESIYGKRSVSFYEDQVPSSPTHDNPSLGMFTAALGTGLAYNISPAASVSNPEPTTPSKDRPSRQRALTGALSAAAASGSGSIRASWRKTRVVWASASSLPVAVEGVSSDEVYAQEQQQRRAEKAKPKVRTKDRVREERERAKKPAVRELAVLPIQRVMRYVLQYRDLLQNTPVESPSRGLVERALESASRIAARCDRAQGNSAFLKL